MKKYLILGFLSFAFVLFGQKQTSNSVEQTAIILPFKGIGNKLNDTLLLKTRPDCKILIDTTRRFWSSLKKYHTADSIQDLKAVLVNLDSIIRITANPSLPKCLLTEDLKQCRDTLNHLYKQAYMNAVKDTIIQAYIARLEKQSNDTLQKVNTRLSIANDEKDVLHYVIGGLIVILLLLLALLFFRKSKKKSEKTTKNTSNTEGSSDEKSIRAKAFSTIEDVQNQEKGKNEALKKAENEAAALKKAEEEKEVLKSQEQERKTLEKAKEEKAKAAAEAAKTIPAFYLSIPSGDGFFSNDNRIPSYRNGNTFYRFYLLSDTEAEFEFCSEATTFAIDQPETHIFRACDQLNTRPDKAKGIATETRGTARLEGDKWVITEKAKIKYLNS